MAWILVPVWALFFLIRYAQTQQALRAALDAGVAFGVLTVVGCELLSLFTAFTALGICLYWALLCGMVALVLRGPLRQGWRMVRAWRPHKLVWYEGVALGILGVCTCCVLLCALLYPPMNYDSLTYHMPRVFFWVKNASVHNYPTAIGRQLFTGPLTELLIAQVQALNLGNDMMASLVQTGSYLGSIAAVYAIAGLLGAGKKGRCLAAVLAATTPMAILQASTTQSDLTLTFWCLMTAYYAVLYVREDLPSPQAASHWALCIGGSAGLAILTKLNALGAIGPFALAVLVCMFRRKAWRVLRRASVLILALILLVNAGFFVRNSLDLDGDFLAYHLPESDALHVRSDDPRDYVLLAAKTFGSSMADWPFVTLNSFIKTAVRGVATALDVPVNQKNISEVGYVTGAYSHIQSHDTRTNPIQAIWSYVTLLALLIGAACVPRMRRFPAVYALAVGAMYWMTVLSMRWTTSVPRYLMAPLLLSYPLIPLVFRGRRWLRSAACVGLACVTLGASSALVFNMFQPLIDLPGVSAKASGELILGNGRYSASHDQMRARSMGVAPEALTGMLAQAAAHDIQRVGLDQSMTIAALYPVMYAYRDSAYDVRYVQSIYAADREDPAFVPDAVYATVLQADDIPPTLVQGGRTFALAAHAPAAVGLLCLYLPQ